MNDGSKPLSRTCWRIRVFWCFGVRLEAINISEFLPFTLWHWDGSKVSSSENMEYKMESPFHPLSQLNLKARCPFLTPVCSTGVQIRMSVHLQFAFISCPKGAVNIWKSYYEGSTARKRKWFRKIIGKNSDISERSKKNNTKCTSTVYVVLAQL